jgi:hypothetical protein
MEERECPRCGSLLPDSDEGVCSTCNYEYGRATLFMPVIPKVNPADIKDGNVPLDDFLSQKPAPLAPAQPLTPAQLPVAAPTDNRKLWLLLGGIVLLLLAVVGALVVVLTQG